MNMRASHPMTEEVEIPMTGDKNRMGQNESGRRGENERSNQARPDQARPESGRQGGRTGTVEREQAPDAGRKGGERSSGRER